MALQHTRLANIQFVPTTAASIYTNAVNTKSYVRGFVIFNGNTALETVELFWVPANAGLVGTPSAGNQFTKAKIAADDTLIIDFPYTLSLVDTNEAIFAKTTTASKVTIILLGDKE